MHTCKIYKTCIKRITLVVTGFLLLILVFSGTAISFTTSNTTISRSFEKNSAVVGDDIVITVTFYNAEASTLRGFFYVEYIPDGLNVTTQSVTIDGSAVSNYTFESGTSGAVYPGEIEYKWILETPTGFLQGNPISYLSTVQIVYSIHTSQSGVYNFNEFDWVGYYAILSSSAFGYSETSDQTAIQFLGSVSSGGDSGGSGGGCFIATAVYGSYEAPFVIILRQFRDQYLLTNEPGRWFVGQYYQYSPPAAEWIRNRETIKSIIRLMLYPLVVFSWLMLKVGSILKLIVVLLSFSALCLAFFLWRDSAWRRRILSTFST